MRIFSKLTTIVLSTALLLLTIGLHAQSTKIRGKVTDAETGEPVIFAAVFFKGTTIGTTTDNHGEYNLETREPGNCILVCQILGYDVEEQEVKATVFNEINFSLKMSDNRLTAVTVKADNRRIKRLLKNIQAHKEENDPDQKPGYECELYNKIELGLTHAREQITNKRILKEFGFIFDYIDTSSVSGVPYLPVMISETIANRMHEKSSETDRETVLANKISGINPENNLLSQFTGSAYLKNNFYKDYVNTLGVEFPSPIQEGGLLFYNYYIIDSLKIDGRKSLLVRFHPKAGISSPALDGQMHIDSEDFALKDIKARMVKTGNVNWLRDLEVEVSYKKDSNGLWFFDSDRMYADFSISLRDSSKMISALGNRQVNFLSHKFNDGSKVSMDEAKVEVDEEANFKNDEYWEEKRPYELSQKEKNIYTMVDAIKEQPLYTDIYQVVETIVNGYWDIGKIGIGPYARVVSYDNLQGFRVQLGMHTSKDFSKKRRYSAYLAYGFLDKKFKGGGTMEWLFKKLPTRKLTINAQYDVHQIGREEIQFTEGTFLSSLTWGNYKISPQLRFTALYDHEFSPDLNGLVELGHRRQYSNSLVPLISLDGHEYPSISSNELRIQARFSHDEIVNRGHFIKTYMNTLFPILTLSFKAGVGNLERYRFAYFSPSATFDWKLKLPPVGVSRMRISAGTVVGHVPYPQLHIFPGDISFFRDKYTFNCMNYMEFASDIWAHFFYEHDFGGFFLGKIPLLKKLNWREMFSLKAAFGKLTERNNGMNGHHGSILRFPEGMTDLREPYVEVGAGISNIFRLFRVDCFWRLTNLERAERRFMVTGGIELKF